MHKKLMVLFVLLSFGSYCESTKVDPRYLLLKHRVHRDLENSWCPAEKADAIMDLIVENGPKICVEIGVFEGASLLPIISAIKYLGEGHVYAIDAWSNEEAIKNMDINDPNKGWWASINFDYARSIFHEMISSKGFSKFCTEIAKPSREAVDEIGEIDFLHIDGNYTSQGSLDDGMLYAPKVKIGGHILVSNYLININHDLPKLDLYYYLSEFCKEQKSFEILGCVLFKKVKNVN